MSNPLLGKKKREQILAIDIGSRTSKGVLLQRRKDEGFSLANFTVQDVPVHEKALSPEMLAEHIRKVSDALGAKTKQVTISVGASDSVLRSTEFPLMPVEEMRQMLKFNSKNYLQQELNDYVFDCYIVPPKPNAAKMDAPKGSVTKYKVWVGGAKRQYLHDLQHAVKSAGLVADQIALSLLGPVNAFEFAQTEAFAKEVVALVDLGFKSTTISILAYGELALNRVVEIGGDKLTSGLSEAMGISYAEAEGIKVGMPTEVEMHLQPLVNALGRELRASVAFFEHQFDRSVGQVLVSGGASRSQFILDNLQSELGVPCKAWLPTGSVELALQPAQMTEIEANSSQLAVAMGAAAMNF